MEKITAKVNPRKAGGSEVYSTQWSHAYPREVGWLAFVSGIAKPYHKHNSTQSTAT